MYTDILLATNFFYRMTDGSAKRMGIGFHQNKEIKGDYYKTKRKRQHSKDRMPVK
jgi:hypothetical protein